MQLSQHIQGCILGTAVGDAIGLAREGLSRRRGRRMFGESPLRHTFVLARGMCSDDTEHTIMVAQAYISSGSDSTRFARGLAWRMRWWFLRIPAGIGLATLRACLKLWIGFPASRSGVRSAGNGPAMRSALLGVVTETDADLHTWVDTSSQITHTDARALQGARIIAHAAQWAIAGHKDADDLIALRAQLLRLADDAELHQFMTAVFEGITHKQTPEQIADALSLSQGVTGYINHTVPMAICCWLTHRGDGPDAFRHAVESAVALGGDSDTVAAIAGALAGAEFGPDAIPRDWLNGLCEWPATVGWMTRLSDALADCVEGKRITQPPRSHGLLLLIRNVMFTAIVLTHGFRRLLPPY
ncbi:ADP-ribosylglycohydrolase family protein [Phycisphaeraceae bacterium D3-23]